MCNKINIAKCKREMRNTCSSRTRVSVTTLTTPKISRLKTSARSMLYRLRRQAKDAGYCMDYFTYCRAKERIREMEFTGQYEDFKEDTERLRGYLKTAIKRNQQAPYFTKVR